MVQAESMEQAIIHDMKSMTTVLNRTRYAARHLAHVSEELAEHLNNTIRQVNVFSSSLAALNDNIADMKASTAVSAAITLMEWVISDYQDSRRAYDLQRGEMKGNSRDS